MNNVSRLYTNPLMMVAAAQNNPHQNKVKRGPKRSSEQPETVRVRKRREDDGPDGPVPA